MTMVEIAHRSDSLLHEENRLAAEAFGELLRRVLARTTDDASKEALAAAYDAASERLWDSIVALVPTIETAEILDTHDGPLVVNGRRANGCHETAEGKIVLDEVFEVTATEDGHYVNREEWHEGESDSATWVRYEVWSPEGRKAHGFVDATSRKLVQVG